MNIFTRIRRKIRQILKEIEEQRRFKHNVAFVKEMAEKKRYARKYIIDCGFNEGIIADKLLEELEGFSLRGFEIQQDIQQFSERLKKKHAGRDIDVIYSAVSNDDDTIEYFEPESWGKNYKGGTTVVENKKAMGGSYLSPKLAPAVDFAAWLSKNFNHDDFLFVKMDIEGAEYEVIDHLMSTHAIDLIDVLAVEWHANKFEEPQSTKYKKIEENIKTYANNHNVTVLDWY